MYRIELTPKAEGELRALGRSGDKASIKKVYRLFEERRVHPYEDTGKPEPLVGDYAGIGCVA
ncbi:MAG: type II toxin-antitoxin system YoeB family toxin [Bacteroidales bacterium]|nr:type II toxin-antitoxin system YoeB family toxin [Bacteroidales bacterium]